MRVACAFDHAGFPLRTRLLPLITEAGHEVIDLGTDRPEPVDYPVKALEIGRALNSGQADRGILVCGSGAGVSIAAGKIRGIRAATIHDTYTAHQGVEHDGLNVLCLGARVVGSELAAEIVTAFLGAELSDEERHVRRRGEVDEIERTGGVETRASSGVMAAQAVAAQAGAVVKRMVECNICGEPLAAATDAELLGRVRSHMQSVHPDATLDEESERRMIADEAYDAADA
jgi:ribose 5-phosphate isomerase B